jgi:hypothetical protein
MNQDNIQREIVSLINMLREHMDNLSRGSLSPAETELMIQKIQMLLEKSILLKHLNSAEIKPVVKQVNEERKVEKPEADFYVSTTEPKAEPPTSSGKENKEHDTPMETTKAVPTKHHVNINKPPLSDIKAGIGLNEKIRYIKELFKGSADEYNTAINSLNSSGNAKSANDLLLSLEKKYSWDKESEIYISFSELVERRFS